MTKRFFTTLFMCCLIGMIHAQYSVSYVSSDGTSISVRSVGYAKKKTQAVEASEQAAIMSLLFRGIPGSQQSQPLVGTDEKSSMATHKAYFDSLLDGKRYKSYITSSIPVSQFGKDASGRKSITLDVTINLKALRADLEQQGVIRKFGI